jgi:uncharacterized paraquat-inducible protein A
MATDHPRDPENPTSCGECGNVFDVAQTDTCPVCRLADDVDGRVVDLQMTVDELLDRIPRRDT